MAHLERYLKSTLLALATGLLGWVPPLVAQSAPAADNAEASTFRVFSLTSDLSDLFYDLRGRQVPFTAPQWLFSQPYPAPENGLVSLYRETPPVPPATKPVRVPVSDIVLGPGGPWLVFLRDADPHAPRPVIAQTYDYSWQAHPVDTVRIFNFSGTQLAAQIGPKNLTLPLAACQNVRFAEGQKRLWLKTAAFINGNWSLKISEPQRVRSGARVTWVFLKMPYVEDDPQPDQIFIRKLTQAAPSTGHP